jgi:DNA-binding protein WhiA
MATGSFSSRVKNELARSMPEKNCCRFAEFSALLRTGGTLGISRTSAGQQLSLYFVTDNAAVARHVFRLGKELYAWPVEIRVRRQERLKKNNRYRVRLVIPEESQDELRKLGILKGRRVMEGVRSSLVKRKCCLRAYLRGVFLGCGSVSNPETSYHLELVLSSEGYAQAIVNLLQRVGLQARINIRKEMQVVYLKEAEQIASLLRLIGAHGALLRLEDVRVMKDMRNQVNRLVNCDTANLEKAVSTGLRQVRMIQYISAEAGLDYLPEPLRQVAELRLEYPEASLKELGNLLDPKLGKSGVNHRLRHLAEIAEQLGMPAEQPNS